MRNPEHIWAALHRSTSQLLATHPRLIAYGDQVSAALRDDLDRAGLPLTIEVVRGLTLGLVLLSRMIVVQTGRTPVEVLPLQLGAVTLMNSLPTTGGSCLDSTTSAG